MKAQTENQIHGAAANDALTPEYQAWVAAKNRCFNPKNKDYRRYGGRGISVCLRWVEGENGIHPFQCFLNDMGYKPSRFHTLDRKEVNGNYEPSNCRWVTRQTQARNRGNNVLLTCDGSTKTLIEWSEHTGFQAQTIAYRLRAGWAVKDAIYKPLCR